MDASLNIEQPAELIRYLRATSRIDARAEAPVVLPLAGGVSNRTVLVRPSRGPAWVVKQALPKLRVADDWFCDPVRIEREALALEWLGPIAPAGTVPRLLFTDPAHHLLAMEAVPMPHENWKAQLLGGTVESEHVRQFGALLGHIHRNSAERRHLLPDQFADRTFFEALRVVPYYQTALERNLDSTKFFEALIAETRATRLCLVHGDYSPKNVLVHQGKLVLLDFEVIHLGDPAFDVGFSLAHLLSKAHHLPAHQTAFLDAARQYWETYHATLIGAPVSRTSSIAGSVFDSQVVEKLESRAVRHTLACLLARVDGRSPLEYLSPPERIRQRDHAKRLMAVPPSSMQELIERPWSAA